MLHAWRCTWLVLVLTTLGVLVRPSGAQDSPPPAEAVNAAIDRGVQFLLATQGVDGSWGSGATPGATADGYTALMIAALRHSGLSLDHQAVLRGAGFVRNRAPTRIYGACTRILMEDSLDNTKDLGSIEAAAEFLMSNGGGGYFDYPGQQRDLSNTQYAILGLWLASKHKVKIPEKVVESTVKALRDEQLKDGGWSYFATPETEPGKIWLDNREASASMTTAGMASLLFGLDLVGRESKLGRKFAEDIDKALVKGHAWLDKYMLYEENTTTAADKQFTRQWNFYFLYNIERLATVQALDTIAKRNWYNAGAAQLLKTQLPDGGWAVGGNSGDDASTAFALLFLNRATMATLSGEGHKVKAKTIGYEKPDEVEVDLRILPGEKSAAWVNGFHPALRERYGRKGASGLRVQEVRYIVDGGVVATVKGDVNQVSSGRFEVKLELEPGLREIECEVLVAPEPAAGQVVGEERVTLRSVRFRVNVDWSVSKDQKLMMAEMGLNLMLANQPEVAVSSERPVEAQGLIGMLPYVGQRATDGSLSDAWVAKPEDPEPWIRMSWSKAVKAQVIVLSPPTERAQDSVFALPRKISISVNGKLSEYELEGKAREHIVLDKLVPIKQLEIKILSTYPSKNNNGTGLAEVELLTKPTELKGK